MIVTMLMSFKGISQQQAGKKKDSAAGNNSSQSSDYKNNKVSGNPNNVTTDEGSNRRHTNRRQETDESSGSVQADSALQDSSGSSSSADPASSNVPAVLQETTSQSGSPAVLSGEEGSDRDGTNNVQRAKPNMAGSDVKGMRYGKHKDTDREIREGTMRQHKMGAGNDVSRSRNKNQQGSRQRAIHSRNPHPTNMGQPANATEVEQDRDNLPEAGSENNTISEKQNNEQMMNDQKVDHPKEKKKKKRWYRRD